MRALQLADQLGGLPLWRDATTLERYQRNVSALERRVYGVVFPTTGAQVRAVVMDAKRSGLALYPISTGANWGMGSKLPVRDGAVIVDLGGMRRIIHVDERYGVAVIEPGVTQRDLARHLDATGSKYFLNVTGSGADTSLIGNALDRGIAHHGPRVDEICGLEVVLGSGEVLDTGTAGNPLCQTNHLYRDGVGPGLEGLFFQSNFGIVTRAGLRLLRKRPVHAVLKCGVASERGLEALVDRAAELVQDRIFEPSIHVANAHRIRSVLGGLLSKRHAPDRVEALLQRAKIPAWGLSAPLCGTQGQVRAAWKEAKRALRGLGPTSLQTEASLHRHIAVQGWLGKILPSARGAHALATASLPSLQHSLGVPSDAALGSIGWSLDGRGLADGTNLDDAAAGTIFVLPVLPMAGATVRAVMTLTEHVFGAQGFTAYATFNAASKSALEAVINLVFDRRDPARVEQAHGCATELIAALGRRGYILCRSGIQSMPQVVNAESVTWTVAARVKAALDSSAVIAPGRYNLS